MPTKKIADPPKRKLCFAPDHEPPTMIVPGTYLHTCSVCGYETRFTVAPDPTLAATISGGFNV